MKGFTLIELIMVIIVLSILSAVGVGLFSSSEQYTTRLAADKWLTVLRSAQRLALLKQSNTLVLNVNIAQSAQAWDVGIRQGATDLNRFAVERENITVRSSTSDFTSACNSLPAVAFPLTLYFDGYGNATNASRVPLSTNLRLCFSGQTQSEICMAPSGYIYEGSCAP